MKKKIEILGMGCPKCKQLEERAQEAIKQLGIEAEVVKVEDVKKISEYKVLITPALAVDGAVKASGKALSVDEIKDLIK